ncbi:MAG TPA: glutamine amidotransferase [Tepidisphaeraceae bacterium]|jgi:uncharacterized membrane protein|nr:glutamine amidotransferase [Tepidisphaeraceae bacterium]
MHRLFEIILGLPSGFLSRQGHFTLQFNPSWPLQQYVGGAAVWNFILIVLSAALVVTIYRREGRTRRTRLILGILRGALLGLVLLLLNRPVLTLGQARREPSVLAVLVDDSISMKVKDATLADGKPASRLDAVVDLLGGEDGRLLRQLAAVHDVRIYDFSRGPKEIANIPGPSGATSEPTSRKSDTAVDDAVDALRDLKPEGNGTQVVSSLTNVLQDLQGQRLAGVVVLTDGRETPAQAPADALAAVKAFGVDIFPIAVGSDHMPQNIAVQSVTFEDTAFVNDYTNLHVTLQASGYEPNHPITLALLRQSRQNGQTVNVPVLDDSGNEITQTVEAVDDKPFGADLQFKPTEADIPVANLVVEAKPQPGEMDDSDNFHPARLDVLDDNITVLYVDGYPRWDYRYLKNSLLRDKTIKVSCLLTSADPSFRQEGSDDPNRPQHQDSWRITAFPESMDQLLDYDVVIMGDVDPRQFTDAQLQMVSDFVSKKGGGFAMVAGPRWSPQSYRNTPIESILPVIITHTEADDERQSITEGFRPVLTRAAAHYPIFRFFPQWAANEEFVKNHLPPIFWYCRGVMIKPGVGITLAEHPTDLGPDDHKAPILVIGAYGTGRTIFSAIDDSWRWRFYTGESVFNTYWVQQLRYLARGRKIGQRKMTFTADRDVYELGKQVTIQLQPLSPDLIQQLSPPVTVQIIDDATGQAVRRLDLQRQDAASTIYSGSFTADRIGQFSAKLPHLTSEDSTISFKVAQPDMELQEPQVDTSFLNRLATESPIPFAQAAPKLAEIRSAAKVIPIDTAQPLWNAPLVMVVFVTLITIEWIVRKMVGLL